MKSTTREVEKCNNCCFFFLKTGKGGERIPYCSYYPNFVWTYSFSAEKGKHPKCKVISIVVNEAE